MASTDERGSPRSCLRPPPPRSSHLPSCSPDTRLPALTSATTCTQHGTVTFGVAGGAIPALDPNTIASAAQWTIQPLLYNGLTKYAHDGSVLPDLAVRWKHSADLKTWWFFLRHGVKYANGRPFTAKDVVANVTRVLDPATASQARGNIKDVQSVRAIGDYEVRFKTGSPSSILPDQVFLTKMSDVANIASKDPKLAGNGTGPYQVASFTPDQTLSLVPNPNYWGPKPCFSQINFVREPDPTSMVTAFTGGKLDLAFQVPTSAVAKIQSDKNASILKPTTISSVQAWEVDTTSPPFDNVVARQALSYAIDRATMVKVAFAGEATPTLTNDLVNPANPAFDKKLTSYTFNLDKAKQLFTQAGVQPGTTFTFLTDGTPEWTTMGEILQQDLQKIGLNLNDRAGGREHVSRQVLPAGQVLSGRDRRELPLAPAEPGPHSRLPHLGQVRVQLEQRDLRRTAVEGVRQHQPSGDRESDADDGEHAGAGLHDREPDEHHRGEQQDQGRVAGPARQSAPRGCPADRLTRTEEKAERRVLGPTVLFIARRTATSIALLALTSVVIFVVMRVIPGDPTITKLGGSIRDLDPQTLRDVRHQLGLDHSLPVQYERWVAGMLHGNFGLSYFSQYPVTTLLGQRIVPDAPALVDRLRPRGRRSRCSRRR